MLVRVYKYIDNVLYSLSSLLCIAQNVRFEIPYKVLYFKKPSLMIFKYYAWASYGFSARRRSFSLFQPVGRTESPEASNGPFWGIFVRET